MRARKQGSAMNIWTESNKVAAFTSCENCLGPVVVAYVSNETWRFIRAAFGWPELPLRPLRALKYGRADGSPNSCIVPSRFWYELNVRVDNGYLAYTSSSADASSIWVNSFHELIIPAIKWLTTRNIRFIWKTHAISS